MKIRLLSSENFLVVCKNFQEELNCFCIIELNLQQNENANILLYPLSSKNALPFCIKCCPFPQEKENLKIYKTPNGYDIFVSLPQILHGDYIIQKLVVGKTSHVVRVFENHIEFEGKDFCKVANVSISSPCFKTISGNIVVYGKNQNNMACAIFCPKTKKLEIHICEQLEISSTNLKLLVPLGSHLCHLLLKNLEFDENGPKTKSEELYAKTSPHSFSPATLPYKFLDAVATKDEQLAKSFLSPALASTQLEAFSCFFGKPEHIYCFQENFLTLYENSKAKQFEFVIENNKIVEIVEK